VEYPERTTNHGHGFAPGFVYYKKRCTQLPAASDKAWRDKIASDYSVTVKGEYDISNDIVARKWNEFCKEVFKP
jgi:hypothetical protein